MSKLLVTAIMDLASRGLKRRNVLTYTILIRYMLDIGYKVVCFIEPKLIGYMPVHENLLLRVKEFDSLATHDLIAKDGKTIYGGHTLSTNFWVYPVTNNAKFFLVNEAMKLYPEYELYVWMDAGLFHADPYSSQEAKEAIDTLDTDKPTICILDFPTDLRFNDRTSILRFWEYNRFNVAGGLMSFPKEQMSEFMKTYIETLAIAKEHNLLLYEEQILPVALSQDWSKYHYRFTEYKCITNLKHIRTDYDKVMRNLHVIPQEAVKDWLEHVTKSIEAGTFRLSNSQMAEFLYYGQVRGYYSCRAISDRLARIIKLIIRDGTEFLQHSSPLVGTLKGYPNVEQNIAYNNVTLEPTWMEHFKLYPDDIKILAYSM